MAHIADDFWQRTENLAAQHAALVMQGQTHARDEISILLVASVQQRTQEARGVFLDQGPVQAAVRAREDAVNTQLCADQQAAWLVNRISALAHIEEGIGRAVPFALTRARYDAAEVQRRNESAIEQMIERAA